jgi:carboxyl-terminal processing protease
MTRTRALAWLVAGLLLVVLAMGPAGLPAPVGPAAAQDACPEASASEEPGPSEPLVMPEEYRVSLFDAVWGAVDRLYLDPGFNGVDWQAVSEEYAPYILQTENAYEVYALLEEMVGLLQDPYTLFLSPSFLEAEARQQEPYGGIGALLDRSASADTVEGLRILYVFPESPAQGAGLRARDRIVAVNGDPCVRIPDIRGPVGTTVTLTIVSPGEEPRDVTVERRTVAPRIVPEARVLPADGRVGYLRLPSLAGSETVEDAQTALAGVTGQGSLDGLLVDLRSTSAGGPAVAVALLGNFVSGEVATLYAREGTSALEVEATDLADELEDVPLVVLVDAATEGPAEQMAAILQDQGRAEVVGQQTSGRTQGVQTVDFPDGSAVQVVAFGLELPDGRRLEETGVTPDVPVDADWLALPEADDPYVAAALELLAEGSPESLPGPSPMPSAEAGPTLSG